MTNLYLQVAMDEIQRGNVARAIDAMTFAAQNAARERSPQFGKIIVALNKTRKLLEA